MEVLIDKWETMRALQAINPVAKLMDGDPVIRMSAVEHVLENLPEAPDINVGNIDTTTHDSIPAKSGRNDEDRTTDDCISRQQAIDEIHEDAEWLASQGSDWQVERMERDKSILMSLPSVQPEIIRCKDCKYYREYGYVNGKPKFLPKCTFNSIYVNEDDFCSKAERKINATD